MDISTTDISTSVQDERDEFVAFLADLAPEQWRVTSLCTDWTVKQLALHYLSSAETSPGRLLGTVAAAGFSPHRATARLISERTHLGHDEVIERLRALPVRTGLHRLYRPAALLLETFTHHQDVRRPLGATGRDIPPQRLTLVADKAATSHAGTGANKRARGLRLEATDLDWSHGQGPTVAGSTEAIVMALMGRSQALTDLSGEGTKLLASRL
jgi:uncharacterized protein (TIGR03083 family)